MIREFKNTSPFVLCFTSLWLMSQKQPKRGKQGREDPVYCLNPQRITYKVLCSSLITELKKIHVLQVLWG